MSSTGLGLVCLLAAPVLAAMSAALSRHEVDLFNNLLGLNLGARCVRAFTVARYVGAALVFVGGLVLIVVDSDTWEPGQGFAIAVGVLMSVMFLGTVVVVLGLLWRHRSRTER